MDRLVAKVRLPRGDLTVGRQAVTFGKAYFWNPLDVFSPFDPRQFDRDYKTGVDAARLDIPVGPLSGLTFVAAAGDTLLFDRRPDEAWRASWFGSALIGRAYATLGGFDWALQGGKVYGGYQVGAGASGEIGPLEIRAEGVRFTAGGETPLPWPLEGTMLEDHQAAVVGAGRWFANTFYLQAEYLYNGLGDPDDYNASLVRFAAGHTFHLGRHVVGTIAGYDFLPILKGSLASIVSLSDGSFQVQPGLIWSVSDDSELLAGALFNFGEKAEPDGLDPGIRSEFGVFPDVYYLQFKIYF
jgi:hypothetical protein